MQARVFPKAAHFKHPAKALFFQLSSLFSFCTKLLTYKRTGQRQNKRIGEEGIDASVKRGLGKSIQELQSPLYRDIKSDQGIER